MESAFKIHSMEEYLNFYIEETERLFSRKSFQNSKKRFLPIASKSNERSKKSITKTFLNSMRESIH